MTTATERIRTRNSEANPNWQSRGTALDVALRAADGTCAAGARRLYTGWVAQRITPPMRSCRCDITKGARILAISARVCAAIECSFCLVIGPFSPSAQESDTFRTRFRQTRLDQEC